MLHLDLKVGERVNVSGRDGSHATIELVEASGDLATIGVERPNREPYATEISGHKKRLVIGSKTLGVALLPKRSEDGSADGTFRVGFHDPKWAYLIERDGYNGSRRWEWRSEGPGDGAQEQIHKLHAGKPVVG